MSHAVLVEDEIEYQLSFSEALELDAKKWSVNNFTRGKDALAFYTKLKTPPSIAVIDIGLPDISGLEVIKKFHQQSPKTPILVYTLIPNTYTLKEALANGARGYILKDDKFISIVSAITQLLQGYTPISPKMTTSLLSYLPRTGLRNENAPKLSTQEHALLELIAAGKSYAVAAHIMGLKLTTIHAYSRSVFRKLNVNSKTQAIVKARELGILF